MKPEPNPLLDSLKALIKEALREELAALNGKNDKPSKLLLTTEEAAKLMGVKATWLADAARENKLPVVRLGHYVRFKIADIEAFVERQLNNGVKDGKR
jgi:excisionase family DNA binding protein